MQYDTLVTEEDYLYTTGINLSVELENTIINDVGDNPAPRFIHGVEEFLKDIFSSAPYGWNREFKTDFQKKQFKKAVINQIQYIMRNGNISKNSGINQETGIITPREVIESVAIDIMTKKAMKDGGMANLIRW